MENKTFLTEWKELQKKEKKTPEDKKKIRDLEDQMDWESWKERFRSGVTSV